MIELDDHLSDRVFESSAIIPIASLTTRRYSKPFDVRLCLSVVKSTMEESALNRESLCRIGCGTCFMDGSFPVGAGSQCLINVVVSCLRNILLDL